ARHRARRAAEARVVAAHAGPQVEAAVPRRRVEVAARVVVDAGLLAGREPVARDGQLARRERPLGHAVARAPAARDAAGGRDPGATRATRVARLTVPGPVVALREGLRAAVVPRLGCALLEDRGPLAHGGAEGLERAQEGLGVGGLDRVARSERARTARFQGVDRFGLAGRQAGVGDIETRAHV